MKNMHFSNSILRYAVLLICFLPMALYAHGAQGKRIILKGQSITMQQAIQLIEENSQYTQTNQDRFTQSVIHRFE